VIYKHQEWVLHIYMTLVAQRLII